MARKKTISRNRTTKSKSEGSELLDELLRSDYHRCGAMAGTRQDPGLVAQVARLRCKCWKCPVCGPKLHRRLANGIANAIEDHELTHFVTLTANEGHDLGLPKLWGNFMSRVRTKYGRRPTYVWVLERHASGQHHLHAVVDMELERTWAAKAWKKTGGGSNLEHNVRIRLVENARSDATYMAKEVLLISAPRRFGKSRIVNLGVRGATSDGWKRAPTTFKQVRESNKSRIIWERRGQSGAIDSFAIDLNKEQP